MLTEICKYLRNWFCYSEADQYVGDFVIRDGTLPLIFLDGVPYTVHANDGVVSNDGYLFEAKIEKNPYIRIIGSRFYDGVWKYDTGGFTGLVDEEFHGAVWVLSIPPAIIALDEGISNWCEANADAINSPYQSESFNGYSYTRASRNGSGSGSAVSGWQDVFAGRLKRWKKVAIL